jgi:hypothetical protein
MAEIVLGLGTSHAPSLHGNPERWDGGQRDMSSPMGGGMKMDLDIDAMIKERESWIPQQLEFDVRKQRHDSAWTAINRLADIYRDTAPDVFVIIGDDTHEVFMPEDHIPTFDVFSGDRLPYVPHPSRVGRDPVPVRELEGQPELGLHLVESLLDAEFDISYTRKVPEGRHIGHAFDFVYGCILKERVGPHVPLWVNTYYPPNQPTLRRCHELGRALRQAIESWDSRKKVAVVATGGMSHLVLDEEMDRTILAALQDKDEERLTTAYPESAFTFGTSEIRNWVVLAGAMADSNAEMNLLAYEPMYRSPAGTGCGCAFAYWR